ncbi:MAG: hypothetical protein KIT84_13085 [Labilithrix sp.]|nr:hypothetical protein [Labilithrix sp.]MCW5811950.1 hypothetical protein [Labilithrix sp.]
MDVRWLGAAAIGVIGACAWGCQAESSTPLQLNPSDAGESPDGSPLVTDPSEGGVPGPDGTTPGGAGCIKDVYGGYALRSDSKVLLADGTTSIVDAESGATLANVTSISDDRNHGCAVTSDGSLRCWRTRESGSNANGQLGNGTKGDTGPILRASRVLRAAGTPLTGVAAAGNAAGSYYGNEATCVVGADAKAYCWGDVTWLTANGSTLTSSYAQEITTDGASPLTGVKQIAYSTNYACAVVQGAAANEVWCWGQNGDYNLGQGDTAKRQYPAKVVGLTNPTMVALTHGTTCAIDGGQVKCWGSNVNGMCGNDGTTSHCPNPIVVLGPGGAPLADATKIVGGDFLLCALRSGAAWCWGSRYEPHATNIGLPNVVALSSHAVVTDDGSYHPLDNLEKTVTPACGAL